MRTATALAGLALALFPLTGANAAAGPPDATSPSRGCYGTACDGRDPALTGCTRGAYRVLVREDAYGGRVELWYGPGWISGGRRTCQVNWARFVKDGQGDDYNVWVRRTSPRQGPDSADKRRTQYSGGDEGTGVIYSDQVHAPDVPAMACVEPARSPRAAGGSRAAAPLCTDAI